MISTNPERDAPSWSQSFRDDGPHLGEIKPMRSLSCEDTPKKERSSRGVGAIRGYKKRIRQRKKAVQRKGRRKRRSTCHDEIHAVLWYDVEQRL